MTDVSDGDSATWAFATDCPGDVSPYLGVRSPVKFYVLDFVQKRGAVTYDELEAETGMPSNYAAGYLARYARRGLLHRERDGPGGRSLFSLTPSGRQRLRYFRNTPTPP